MGHAGADSQTAVALHVCLPDGCATHLAAGSAQLGGCGEGKGCLRLPSLGGHSSGSVGEAWDWAGGSGATRLACHGTSRHRAAWLRCAGRRGRRLARFGAGPLCPIPSSHGALTDGDGISQVRCGAIPVGVARKHGKAVHSGVEGGVHWAGQGRNIRALLCPAAGGSVDLVDAQPVGGAVGCAGQQRGGSAQLSRAVYSCRAVGAWRPGGVMVQQCTPLGPPLPGVALGSNAGGCQVMLALPTLPTTDSTGWPGRPTMTPPVVAAVPATAVIAGLLSLMAMRRKA